MACAENGYQGCSGLLFRKLKRTAEKIGIGIGVAIAIEVVDLQKPIAIPMPIPTLFMRLGARPAHGGLLRMHQRS
jgi:hypothetical protein